MYELRQPADDGRVQQAVWVLAEHAAARAAPAAHAATARGATARGEHLCGLEAIDQLIGHLQHSKARGCEVAVCARLNSRHGESLDETLPHAPSASAA